jgi:glycosyltransferase involved in cell wall biosynthesis
MDSDPAEMLIASGGLDRLARRWVRTRLRRRVRLADATIFNGRGVLEKYGRHARQSVVAETVWLQDGELASEARTVAKFGAPGPARLAVPTRFTAWKGVDDVIAAVTRLRRRAGEFSVDLIGDGPLKPRLIAQVERADQGQTIRFVAPVPYGEPFFDLLRSYHVVLVPTRGLEEARVVYDAAASGCVLIHSRTSTLDGALGRLATRWTHEPGDPESLADAISDALDRRESWGRAALEGLEFMRGRTIDTMHRKRAEFLARLRQARVTAVAPVGENPRRRGG